MASRLLMLVRVLSSTLTLPRLLVMVVLAGAGLAWTVTGSREPEPQASVARADNPFSLWQPLYRLGCAPPNERGSFIAAKLLRDGHGDPYIFECSPEGMSINGVFLQ